MLRYHQLIFWLRASQLKLILYIICEAIINDSLLLARSSVNLHLETCNEKKKARMLRIPLLRAIGKPNNIPAWDRMK